MPEPIRTEFTLRMSSSISGKRAVAKAAPPQSQMSFPDSCLSCLTKDRGPDETSSTRPVRTCRHRSRKQALAEVTVWAGRPNILSDLTGLAAHQNGVEGTTLRVHVERFTEMGGDCLRKLFDEIDEVLALHGEEIERSIRPRNEAVDGAGHIAFELSHMLTVRMAQVPAGRNAIADQLLQLFHLREAALCRARPDGVLFDPNLENSSAAGL